MNDKLLKKFNEIERAHWWWEGRRELIKILISKGSPKKILDVGCGAGETLRYLEKLFPKATVYGVDNSAKAVKYSMSRGHKNVVRADALKLPFKDNFFDVVLFLDVLEHIRDHQKALNEAKRVLKKGGEVIITSPALSFIWSAFDDNQGHKRRYTRREIRNLSTKANMKMNFISYFNFFLSPPIIAIRLLSKVSAFKHLSNYDRGFNYDIAFKHYLNSFLRKIFVSEIKLINTINYPIGISIIAVLEKK